MNHLVMIVGSVVVGLVAIGLAVSSLFESDRRERPHTYGRPPPPRRPSPPPSPPPQRYNPPPRKRKPLHRNVPNYLTDHQTPAPSQSTNLPAIEPSQTLSPSQQTPATTHSQQSTPLQQLPTPSTSQQLPSSPTRRNESPVVREIPLLDAVPHQISNENCSPNSTPASNSPLPPSLASDSESTDTNFDDSNRCHRASSCTNCENEDVYLVTFHPCEGSFLCNDCAMGYLARNQDCPLCRRRINMDDTLAAF